MENPIIFLDIDGVLNTLDYDAEADSFPIHRDKVRCLNGILAATDSRVVVSSSWRYSVHHEWMGLHGLDLLLRSHGLAKDRIVGVTCSDEQAFGFWDRAGQCRKWLDDNQHSGRHLAIDDKDLGFRRRGFPLLQTDPAVGLGPINAAEAIAWLSGATPAEAARAILGATRAGAIHYTATCNLPNPWQVDAANCVVEDQAAS